MEWRPTTEMGRWVYLECELWLTEKIFFVPLNQDVWYHIPPLIKVLQGRVTFWPSFVVMVDDDATNRPVTRQQEFQNKWTFLRSYINMDILIAVLDTLLMILVERICYISRPFSLFWWSVSFIWRITLLPSTQWQFQKLSERRTGMAQ